MSGSAFMDALMDPAVDALAGMAQGFGQAAMPSRMPVPIGAVIGAGAGGMLQGARTAQAMQMSQQQIKRAQIGNQRAQMLLDYFSPKGGAAQGAAGSPNLPGGGSAPFGAPPMPDANGQYLISPQNYANLGNLAMATGQDRSAATLYGMTNPTASQGYGMSPAGTNFPVPGGPADPRTMATGAAAKANATVPATLAGKGFGLLPDGTIAPIPGGEADPVYQGQLGAQKPIDLRVGGLHWDAAKGWVKNPERVEVTNPDGSKGYAFVAPPAPGEGQQQQQQQQPSNAAPPPDPFPGWAKQINGAENNTGNPAATNPASTATGNGQFLAGTWPSVIRATRPDLAGGQTDQQLLALRSNPELAQSATESYARQNGALLAQSGLPVTGETVGLAHALGAGGAIKVLKAQPQTPLAMLLPQEVIAANPQFQGKTAGDAVQWSSARMGTPLASTGAPVPAGGGGSAVPVLGQDGKPLVEQIPPQITQGREAVVKEFQTKDMDAYQAAQNTQAWVHQIESAADTMSKAGPAYMTGPYAQARLGLMSGANDVARSIGVTAPFDQGALASWEEMKKATTTAGFELSSHYEGHARQAAATIMNATSAVPGMENSPVGLKLVAAGIHEGAQSAIDLHNYRQTMLNQTQGGDKFMSAETDFYTAHPAEQYAQRAISTVHPVQITSEGQLNNYLPGTYAVLPNGKLTQVPARPNAPPIPPYLQQTAQQPQPAQAASATQ